MWYHNPTGRRDGFALPVALLAIMVIGAIVTGGFYASSQESRISTSTDLANQAFYVAEYGLEESLGTWSNTVLENVDGDTVFDAVTVVVGGSDLGTYQISVRRIGEFLFVITSEGRVTAGSREAVRRVGTVARTTLARAPYQAAMAVFGGLIADGKSQIRGEDSGGPGCTTTDTTPGVIAPHDSLVTQTGASDISGDPPVGSDSSMTTSTLSDFGAVSLDDLIAMATHTYGAGETEKNMEPVTTTDGDGNTVCADSVKSNWGDPAGTGACGDYMPIIHAEEDLLLEVGTGQGILIVEGDLYLQGNFDFYGLVIVKGSLYASGTGNHIEGSVLVQGDGDLLSESTSSGDALVQYSRCRVERAFDSAFRPRQLGARSWMDLTANTRGEADDN